MTVSSRYAPTCARPTQLVGRPRPPTDDEFIGQVVLRSPLAFYTDNAGTTLDVNMTAMKDIVQYENTYFSSRPVTRRQGHGGDHHLRRTRGRRSDPSARAHHAPRGR